MPVLDDFRHHPFEHGTPSFHSSNFVLVLPNLSSLIATPFLVRVDPNAPLLCAPRSQRTSSGQLVQRVQPCRNARRHACDDWEPRRSMLDRKWFPYKQHSGLRSSCRLSQRHFQFVVHKISCARLTTCKSRVLFQRSDIIGVRWMFDVLIAVEGGAQNLVVHCHSGIRVRDHG